MHEEIPPKVVQGYQVHQCAKDDQVPIMEGGNDVPMVPPKSSNSRIREALLALAQAMTT